jgi:hypothetical protein
MAVECLQQDFSDYQIFIGKHLAGRCVKRAGVSRERHFI